MPLECIRQVLVDDLGIAAFERGLIQLPGNHNGERVLYSMSPATAIIGIASVQKALFGRVIQWPKPQMRLFGRH